MADIDNPQIRLICNEKMRPLSGIFGAIYNHAKALQAEAQAEGWGPMFPATADIILDGARNDGRAEITSADVNQLIAITSAFITFMEQSSNANRNLVLKVAVNPERL